MHMHLTCTDAAAHASSAAGSIVSAVDNARKLRDSMLPAERTKWQVVWDSSASSWDAYGELRATSHTASIAGAAKPELCRDDENLVVGQWLISCHVVQSMVCAVQHGWVTAD